MTQVHQLYLHIAVLLHKQLRYTAQIQGVLSLPHTGWLFQRSQTVSYLHYKH